MVRFSRCNSHVFSASPLQLNYRSRRALIILSAQEYMTSSRNGVSALPVEVLETLRRLRFQYAHLVDAMMWRLESAAMVSSMRVFVLPAIVFFYAQSVCDDRI
jgi:hypothetical protein